jgi:ankyrin repeat protein
MANIELGSADWVNASLAEALLARQGPPLLVGARLGCVAAVRVMADVGANLEIADEQGWRPLHAAAAFGHDTVLAILVSAGANIEARDAQGHTPLMTAVLHGQQSAVELLMAVGANMKTRRNDGLGLMDIARQHEACPEILELIAMALPVPMKPELAAAGAQ